MENGSSVGETFFEEQIIVFEEPTRAPFSSGSQGVDARDRAPWNSVMAPAREVSEPASLEETLAIAGVERTTPKESETLRTGVGSLDHALGGGVHAGVLTEVASPTPSSGGQTLILHLLEAIRRAQRFAALVDGSNCFDPQSAPPSLLEHLLWARCTSALEAMKVADALLRDENLGMALVDLRGNDAKQLRRVKSADWYKLQRLAERSSAYVCVFTPKPMIPSAQIRVELKGSLSLELADASLAAIGAGLNCEALRLRQLEVKGFPKLIRRQKAIG